MTIKELWVYIRGLLNGWKLNDTDADADEILVFDPTNRELKSSGKKSSDFEPASPAIQAHIASTANPHDVTKTQVGLGNCDNTSDANKPLLQLPKNATYGNRRTPVALTADYDADTINDTGFYIWLANTTAATHLPTTGWYHLIHFCHSATTYRGQQVAINNQTSKMYIRWQDNSGVWSAWARIITTESGVITSAELKTMLSDETGNGAAVFATSPNLTTPNIGAATGESLTLTKSGSVEAILQPISGAYGRESIIKMYGTFFNASPGDTGTRLIARLVAGADAVNGWSGMHFRIETVATTSGVTVERIRWNNSGKAVLASLIASRLVATNVNNELVNTISSADLAASISDEVGSGFAVFEESGTFTPQIKFNMESTGITYAAQYGHYIRQGSEVTIHLMVELSNKGSSYGIAKITGLPFTQSGATAMSATCALRLGNITFSGQGQAYVENAATTIQLEQCTEAGARSNLMSTNFTNTSVITITCRYKIY